MNKKRFVLAFLTAFISLSTFAQNCPQGIPQGTPSCVPPDQLGYSIAPPVNTAYWKKTWGAMAQAKDSLITGTSTGYFNRRTASKEAIKKCKANGGNACELILAYQNQCAVMAKPPIKGEPIQIAYQGAATIQEATQHVLPYCSQINDGKTCEVFYSNCTAPVLIR